MGHLGVAVLGVAELGIAVLGVVVLGVAVLHPAPQIQPGRGSRPSFQKEHHTACSGNQGTMAASKTGHLGVAVLGVAELGTTVNGGGQFLRQEQYPDSRQHVQ